MSRGKEVSFDLAAQDERITKLQNDFQEAQQGQAEMLGLLQQLVPKPPAPSRLDASETCALYVRCTLYVYYSHA